MQVRKALKILTCLAVLAASLLFVQTVFAQDFGLNEVGNEIALAEGDPRVIAAKIVRVALGFLGVVALGIILYGGFVWMTSAGNEEKISTAKKILTNGLIGLVIILMAFGITQYVLNTLMSALTGGGGPGGGGGPPAVGRYSGALGNSIIESHYPPRGGTGIARDTKIIITFKEPMALDSIIEGYEINDPADPNDDTLRVGGAPITPTTLLPLKSENIRIYQSLQGETGAGTPPILNYLQPNQVNVTFTDDHQNFVFDPVEDLGSPTENIWYTTSLKPGLKKADGSNAFGDGAFSDGYAWDFEVSTIVDVTPPKVESVIPGRDTTNARNILVQVNFDEAMDPTTVAGKTAERFDKITVTADGAAVAGTWAIGNQYKTIEFTTDLLCGTNSCGGDVFCLPAPIAPATTRPITVTVKAAELGTTPPEAEMPYTGATDVVGNSLDGTGDGIANGPTADNYLWNFRTNNEIDLIPPRIEAVKPGPPNVPAEVSDVPLDAPIEMQFSKQMSVTSFSSENIILDDNERAACAVWFTLGGEGTNADGTIPSPKPPDWTPVKHKAIIYHGDFIESTEDPTPAPICADRAVVDEQLVRYFPRATHRIKDIYQNCFFTPPTAGPQGPAGGTTCTTTVPGGACQWDVE